MHTHVQEINIEELHRDLIIHSISETYEEIPSPEMGLCPTMFTFADVWL